MLKFPPFLKTLRLYSFSARQSNSLLSWLPKSVNSIDFLNSAGTLLNPTTLDILKDQRTLSRLDNSERSAHLKL